MGIKSDFDEAKELWQDSSLLTKLFVIVAVFLTYSSIASLSDAVFKWKGFILDGIKFYQDWITAPITNVSAKLGLHYGANEVDILILYCIVFVMPQVRVSLSLWDKIGRKQQVNLLFFVVAFIGFLLLFGSVVNELSDIVALGCFLVFLGTLILALNNPVGSDLEEIRLYGSLRKWRLIRLGPIVFSISLI